MKVLYILKQDPNATAQIFMDEQKKIADVTVIDLRTNKNYDEIISQVEANDKIITW